MNKWIRAIDDGVNWCIERLTKDLRKTLRRMYKKPKMNSMYYGVAYCDECDSIETLLQIFVSSEANFFVFTDLRTTLYRKDGTSRVGQMGCKDRITWDNYSHMFCLQGSLFLSFLGERAAAAAPCPKLKVITANNNMALTAEACGRRTIKWFWENSSATECIIWWPANNLERAPASGHILCWLIVCTPSCFLLLMSTIDPS